MSHANDTKSIFADALELPAAEREAFIDRACGKDQALRARITDLIRVFESQNNFMAAPTAGAPAPATGSAREAGESVGSWIGPFRLLQLLGEGGFGAVFMAEQHAPVARRVALKVIKLGMDTRAVIARFEAERQALAVMDHPNISRVLDAGTTESGRPYFVMELVKGDPITQYCDRNNLSIPDRLDLFVQVCQAVQHAHGKGIIHRDLKPSNVLVCTQDGRPFAKVIDFGIAKATSSRLTERTLFTEHRQLIGTPEYMSPEQAEGSLDIDTRSDVYSLGVLLYELLTGGTPFDSTNLRSAAYGELQRIIREVEPPRPSTRASQEGAARPAVATHRRTDPGKIGTLIRGDLDWVVMKALEKDRSRRYETANGLAMDVQRHLRGEAVTAAPPSPTYLARKFLRRHRAVFIGASAVLAALVVGLGVSLVLLMAVLHERNATEAALARAVQAEGKAATEAEVATAINGFLNSDLLGAVRPAGDGLSARGRDVKVATVVEEAARRIDEQSRPGGKLSGKPLVEAGIRGALGEAFQSLGMPRSAEPQLRLALKRRVEAGRTDDRQSIAVGVNLGNAIADQGRFEEAISLLSSLLDTARRVLPPNDALAMSAMATLVVCHQDSGDLTRAEALAREVYQSRLAAEGPESRNTLGARHNLGIVLYKQRRIAEAAEVFDQNVPEMKRVLGAEDLFTINGINMQANIKSELGQYAQAESLAKEGVEGMSRVMGPEHPLTLGARCTLGQIYRAQNRLADGEGVLVPTLAAMRRVLGEKADFTRVCMNELAMLYALQGRDELSAPLMEELLVIEQTAVAKVTANSLDLMLNLMSTYRRLGRTERSREMADAAVAAARSVLDSPDASSSTQTHAAIVLLRVKPDSLRDPVAALRLATRASQSSGGSDLSSARTLAEARFAGGDVDGAIEAGKAALKLTPAGSAQRQQLVQLIRSFGGWPEGDQK